MNSKDWIERALEKPKPESKDATGKRAWFTEALLQMKKEKG